MGEDGNPYISAYAIDGPARAEMQCSLARYGAGGEAIGRFEPKLGTTGASESSYGEVAPPASLSYPAPAQWTGGIVAPEYGRYVFELDSLGGGLLELDGKVLLTVPPDAQASARQEIVLARGLHNIRLAGTLESANGRIDMKWGTTGDLWPVAQRFLWNGAPGSLLGTAYPSSDPSWFTTPEPVINAPPSIVRLDEFLSWWTVNRPLMGDTYAFGRWQGTLIIPEAGEYTLNPVGDGNIALWLDGQPVAGKGVPGIQVPLPLTVQLEAGPHPFELRFQATQDGAGLHLQWQKPGGEPEIIPPSAFTPATGGAWPAAEMPGAPMLHSAAVIP
jgi:hypothetical protein